MILAAADRINQRNPISFMFSPYERFLNDSSPAEIKQDMTSFFSQTVTQVIFGFNSDEGSLLLTSLDPDTFPDTAFPNVSSGAQAILTDLFVSRLDVPKAVLTLGLNSAFSQNQTLNQTHKAAIDFVGNNIFICPTIIYAQELSKLPDISIHFFHFTQRSSYNRLPLWFGTIHNEEVPIMFGYPLRFPEQFTAQEIRFSQHLIRMISRFSRDGLVFLFLTPGTD